jgi:glutamyl-tRNA synthetase
VRSSYRGRLAPSPTGLLHVGHARTFWTASQRARDAGGALILRMDDLDPERSRAEFAEAAIEDLRWLGIRWQEGPDKGGEQGPYLQSRRLAHYEAALHKLIRRGFVYPCRCSRRDLAQSALAPHESRLSHGAAAQDLDRGVQQDDEPLYPGTCRTFDVELAQLPGPTSVRLLPQNVNWRFRVPDGVPVDFGDFLVWRRDNVPSYQLASTVDDGMMEISEVVRGADLLKSTARQILLFRALGYPAPNWFHCELVVDHNGQRLAKRHDALALRALRQRGLTPMNILSAAMPMMAESATT